MLSCCAFGVVRSQFVLLLSSWCVFLPSSFCPPHILLWSFCCPFAVVLFALLSEAGARAATARHHNNHSCRLGSLGSVFLFELDCKKLQLNCSVHAKIHTESRRDACNAARRVMDQKKNKNRIQKNIRRGSIKK